MIGNHPALVGNHTWPATGRSSCRTLDYVERERPVYNGTVQPTKDDGTDNNGWVTVVNKRTRKQQSKAVNLPRNAGTFRESFS